MEKPVSHCLSSDAAEEREKENRETTQLSLDELLKDKNAKSPIKNKMEKKPRRRLFFPSVYFFYIQRPPFFLILIAFFFPWIIIAN